MTTFRPFLLGLYWGGDIVQSNIGLSYSPPYANHVMRIISKVSFSELETLIYQCVVVDRNVYKLKMLFRRPYNFRSYVIYNGVAIVDDFGMEVIYEVAREINSFLAEIYILSEVVTPVPQMHGDVIGGSHGPFQVLLQSIPQYIPRSIPQSNVGIPSHLSSLPVFTSTDSLLRVPTTIGLPIVPVHMPGPFSSSPDLNSNNSSTSSNTFAPEGQMCRLSHNCSGANQGSQHTNLTSSVIATQICHAVEEDPYYTVKNIQADIKKVYGVDVSYKKAWHGRRKAIETVYGDWKSSFAELPGYVAALKQANSGTIVEWQHHPVRSGSAWTFKYIFWAFGLSIEAFHKCRPVIGVDSIRLRGTYKGKLLVAATQDANNYILLLAFAVVDDETVSSWNWFMQQLRLHVAFDRHPLCIVSNRHKGIVHVMNHVDEWKEPIAFHRFCLKHVRNSFMAKFKNLQLKKLCWSIGSARQKRKWKLFRNQIQTLSVEGWQYLSAIDQTQWCSAFDENHRWGTLTTNISQSYNTVLRGVQNLPIKAIVDITFRRTMKMFINRKIDAYHCCYKLPSNIWTIFKRADLAGQRHHVREFDNENGVYKVTTAQHINGKGGNCQTVRYYQRHCTCGKWQMYRYPCSHALAVCRLRRDDPYVLVNEVYTVSTYIQQYSGKFTPVSPSDYWPDPGWELQPDWNMFTS